MDILFVTAGARLAHADFEEDNLSGTESQIRGVAQELARQGHKVEILRRGESNSKNHIGQNIYLRTIPADFPLSLIGEVPTKVKFSREVEKYIQKTNPDVVNITMKYSSLFTCTVEQPVVHFAFNNPSDIIYNSSFISRLSTGTVEKWIASQVDGLVVRNNAAFEWASKRSSIVRQIPCGIDSEEYQNRGDEEFILFGGRFVDVKNIDHIIKAYSRLPSPLQNQYSLHLVGEGPLENELKELVDQLGLSDKIEFQPWLPKNQFREKIAKSSIMVLASDQEGMPVSAIEAMACEKPVIGSDVPGIQDLINDGENGLLFERGNVAELSQKLILLLKDFDKKNELGTTARKTVEGNNSFQRVASEYMDLYQNIQQ